MELVFGRPTSKPDVLVFADNEAIPDSRGDPTKPRNLRAVRTLSHRSGAPWLLGDWSDEHLHCFPTQRGTLALLGHRAFIDLARAADLASRIQRIKDVPRVLDAVHGPMVVAAEQDGAAVIHGDIVGVCPIYLSSVDGRAAAATSVSRLLALTGDRRIDTAAVAGFLLSPIAPWPIADRMPWHAVAQLPPGSLVELATDGSSRSSQWWHPPKPDLCFDDAAVLVRQVLLDSCAARASMGRISADLSGGLDSTALCFALAEVGADCATFHLRPDDPANNDSTWAEWAAGELGGFDHHVLPAGRDESLYAIVERVASSSTATGKPDNWATGRAHVVDVARQALDQGSSLHVCGLGGDELFGMLPAYPWSYLRSCSLRQLRALNNYRLGLRVGLLDFIRALTDTTTHGQHLTRLADDLQAGVPTMPRADLSWSGQVWLPRWATPLATDLARSSLEEAADESDSGLDVDRTRHQLLASLRFEGATIHQVNRWIDDLPLQWSAPFLDQRVVEAVMSVRTTDWFTPRRPKHLLTTALETIVPGSLRRRTDKGEYSAEAYRGLRARQSLLGQIADNSYLAELGLIDPEQFRASVNNVSQAAGSILPFDRTLAVELWLRENEWGDRREAVGSRPCERGEVPCVE